MATPGKADPLGQSVPRDRRHGACNSRRLQFNDQTTINPMLTSDTNKSYIIELLSSMNDVNHPEVYSSSDNRPLKQRVRDVRRVKIEKDRQRHTDVRKPATGS